MVTNRDASLFLHNVVSIGELLYRPSIAPALAQLCAWKLLELYDVKAAVEGEERRERVRELLDAAKSAQPYVRVTLAALDDPYLVKWTLSREEMRAILRAIADGRATRVDRAVTVPKAAPLPSMQKMTQHGSSL